MQMNYINNQTSLKIELDWIPKNNHIVWVIDAIVESIPIDDLEAESSWTGRLEYPAKMLLKMLLFAYDLFVKYDDSFTLITTLFKVKMSLFYTV